MGSAAIGAVVAEMDRVRAGLPRRDGIGVFIDVYRQVTALVAERVTDGTFADEAFIEDLDVRFRRSSSTCRARSRPAGRCRRRGSRWSSAE